MTTETKHNPGGKVKTALPEGLQGDAMFSECGRYRPLLRRWLGDAFPERFVLFIGMNPSTADASFNDPTITREWGFTVREGFDGYAKVNVGDYRATAPADLLKDGVIACSEQNLWVIAEQASKASLVIVCHGKLNKALTRTAAEIMSVLGGVGVPLQCFGTNADGSPKHPLYLRSDSPLQPFNATPKIFVFGSNIAGRHGKGAALWAKDNRGAIYGVGQGLQGQSYAIPTKGVSPTPKAPMPTLTLAEIKANVETFITFARANPQLQFEVTPIGCGHAGYKPDQIAPMFRGAPDNCQMPAEFKAVLELTNLTSGEHP